MGILNALTYTATMLGFAGRLCASDEKGVGSSTAGGLPVLLGARLPSSFESDMTCTSCGSQLSVVAQVHHLLPHTLGCIHSMAGASDFCAGARSAGRPSCEA